MIERTRYSRSTLRLGRWPIFGLTLAALVGGAGAAAAGPVLPTGGQVQAGAATIGAPSGGALTINQTSSRAIVDWSSFSIGAGASVQFNNGSGATLNRVTGGSVSAIDGLLSGTGSVFLIDPDGVIIGKDGVVNVGGTFAASTQNLTNANFMGGGNLTFSGTSDATVINEGKIDALGGDVALIAARVENDGQITAPNGDVGLAASYGVVLTDRTLDNGRFQVLVGGANTAATNAGAITAAEVELRANGGNVYALAGNTGSIIKATGVSASDGKVFLVAQDGTLNVAGTIQAHARDGGGGFIETSGSNVSIGQGTIDPGVGGTWLIDPYDLTIDATAASTIESSLGAGASVDIQTTATGASGPGVSNPDGNGDIIVQAPISWTTGASLTLDAYRSIAIDAPITVGGAGQVNLITDDGGTGGDYSFAAGANLSFIGIPNSGQALTINGQAYTLIYTQSDLLNINNNLAGNYALADFVNLSGTTFGTAPIADYGQSTSSQFTGVFTGLGNEIVDFTLNTSENNSGLFGSSSGTLRDVGLVNVSVSGDQTVGPLVGRNYGNVLNSFASGSVSGFNTAGGLVGINYGGVLNNDHASTEVGITGEDAGGLIGVDSGGTLTNSYATGQVTGVEQVGGLAGGAGFSATVVTNIYATGNVTGSTQVGGLIGSSQGASVSDAWASGSVTSAGSAGGLIGDVELGTITQSYSLGSVTGSGEVGGLIGDNYGGSISSSYATGAVGGTGEVGGVVGLNTNGGSLTGVYWDEGTTGQTVSSGSNSGTEIGVVGIGGATGRSPYEAPSYAGLTFAVTPGGSGWVIVDTDGSLNNAGGAAGGTRPMLLSEYSTTISNGHQLQLMELDPSANYTLANDINLSATANGADVWSAGSGFVPIGGNNAATDFTGTFEGAGHTISNLTITFLTPVAQTIADGATYDGEAGLFGGIGAAGVVRDVTVANASVTGGDDMLAGALAGSDNGTIANASSSGVVQVGDTTDSVTGHGGAGGLVGAVDLGGAVSNSNSSASVTGGDGTEDGGLASFAGSGASISDSHATGAVTTGARRATSKTSGDGNATAGGLVATIYGYLVSGVADNASVSNSYSTGAVSGGGGSFVGGFVGVVTQGQVTNAYASGAVVTQGGPSGIYTIAGGFVGLTGDNGSIADSYSLGAVTSPGSSYNLLGGFAGEISGVNPFGPPGSSTVTRVYATGQVQGPGARGGLVGYIDGGSLTDSYWDEGTTGLTFAYCCSSANGIGSTGGLVGVGGATGVSPYAAASYGNLDLAPSGPWVIFDGSTRPILRTEYSTTIANGHQLQLMALDPSANYTLATNIDLSATGSSADVWNPATGLVPIGNEATPFGGLFNGEGHTISGLMIDLPSTNYVGLFGWIGVGAVVENVGLVGGSVNGNYAVGALAGYNSGTIEQSYATSEVSVSSYDAGGLVGLNNNLIASSFSSGSVTGPSGAGGLVGENYFGTIAQSYATGTVTGTGSYGIGGLVGYDDGYSIITQSYATGAVIAGVGSSDVGGLVGYAPYGGAITQSYWDTLTSGQSSSAGGAGLTTTQLQAALPSGFASPTWSIAPGETYPYLSWQFPTGAPQVVSGFAYASDGATGLVGASVTAVARGSQLQSALTGGAVTSGANGYYYDLLAPGTLPASATNDVGVQDSVGVAFEGGESLTDGSVANLNITAGEVSARTTETALSALYVDINSTFGGPPAQLGTDALSFQATGAFTIDQALSSAGRIQIDSGGSLTIAPGGSVASSASAEAVVLTANGNFINEAGASAVTAANGSWLIYSTAPTSDAFGGLNSDDIAVWDVTADGSVSATGDRYVFAYQPTLTVTTTSDSKTYGTDDGGAIQSDYTVTGLQPGVSGAYFADAAAPVYSGAPSITSGGSVLNASVDGGPYAITATRGTLSVGDGYATAFSNTGTLTVNPLAVSLTGSQVYSGATSVAGANLSAANLVSGDTLTISGTAIMAAKDVVVGGTEAITSLSGLVLSSDNYTLTGGSGAVDVTPDRLTDTLVGGVTKVYNGATAATLTAANYTPLTGILAGDHVTMSRPAAASYASKDVGSGILVTATNVLLSGAQAADYSVIASGPIGAITPKALTASLIGTVTRVYDATTDATLAATNYRLTGVVSGDTVGLNDPNSGSFATQNVGSGIDISVAGVALTNNTLGDYVLASNTLSGAIGKITPLTLTDTLVGPVERTYDGTTTATLASANYSLTGVLPGDSVALNDPTSGAYNNATAGTGKMVTVTGVALVNNPYGDYALASSTLKGAVGIIDPKALTASLVGTVDKTYNGTTTATLSAANYSLTGGIIAGDAVSLNDPATGTYSQADVGTNLGVTVTSLKLTGANAADYTIGTTTLSASIGEIDPKTLTASLVGTVTKVYDATTTATLAATNYKLTGVVAGDTITLNDPTSGAFSDPNAGSGKTVTVTGLALDGVNAFDYQLGSTTISGAIGKINPLALTATLVGTVVKTADGTNIAFMTASNYDLTGVLAPDVTLVALNDPATGAYNNAAKGTGKKVTVTGLALTGAAAGNYTVNATASAPIGTIH